MAWDTEMVIMLRAMIGDLDSPYRYSDSRLQQVITTSAIFVNSDVRTYTSTFAVDPVALTITPDPTDRTTGTRDEDYITLVLLKSACFTDHGRFQNETRGDLSVKEFGTSVSRKSIIAQRAKILETGFCKKYDDILFAYLAGDLQTGQAILSPFREYYYSVYEDYACRR
jgi:hypothetical protein